jgi:hypothetical protein
LLLNFDLSGLEPLALDRGQVEVAVAQRAENSVINPRR